MIAFRQRHLGRALTRLVTGGCDATMVNCPDMVGKTHTTEAGSAELDVPLVQMNTLMGFGATAVPHTILSFGLDRQTDSRLLLAFGKLPGIRNNLTSRHYQLVASRMCRGRSGLAARLWRTSMKTFLGRMKAKDACPPRKPMPAILWSWLGSLVGIYAIAACTPLISGAFGLDGGYMLGSFGAAAVLLYGAPMAEFSQPRNLVVGNLVSALVGVTVAAHIPSPGSAAFAAAIAVSSSVLVMHLLRSMHPPGGATALIAVVGGDGIRGLGYWYVLFPVLGGALILLAVALIVNNISRNPHRHYPVYWF